MNRSYLVAAAVCACIVTPAHAQEYRIDLPSQLLSKSLMRVSDSTGLQVVFTDAGVTKVVARSLSGTYTPKRMLQRLLEASNYSFTISGNVVHVHPVHKALVMPINAFAASVEPTMQSAGAPAQSVGEQTDDIVVTATRLSVGSQNVPIALTAIGGDQLARNGITSTSQLSQLAPSLYVQEGLTAGTPRFSLRGVTGTDSSAAGSAAVAIYIDDVYQASQYATSMQLFDLQRVEVLRGPQGTTFGKNTTAGAVGYFSQTPTNKVEGYVSARLADGDRPERFLESAINVPIIDDILALRVSLRTDSQSDYVRDTNLHRRYGGGNSQAGRIQLRWTPAPDTTVNLIAFGTRRRGGPPLYHSDATDPCGAFGGFAGLYLCPGGLPLPTPPINPDTIALTNIDLYEDFNNAGSTLRIEQGIGDFTLTSISHYRKSDVATGYDLDGSPGDLFQIYYAFDNKQYGQEFRLSSDPTKPLSGIFGLYYQYDSVYDGTAVSATENGPPLDNNVRYSETTLTRTYAAFANISVKATDSVTLIGGLRKSVEKKTMAGVQRYYFSGAFDWETGNVRYDDVPPTTPDIELPFNVRQESSPWTWDATVNFRPSQSLMVFGRAAKGFRSGGFNVPTFTLPAAVPPPFGPETIRSYEIGFKSDLLDRQLRINGTIFHYDFTDQQVSAVVDGLFTTANAGRSKINGGELEVTAYPTKALEFRGSVGYANAKFVDYDPGTGVIYDGNRLLQSPKWTLNGSLAYTLPVSAHHSLRASTNWSYRSEIFFDAANDPNLRGAPLTLGNARIELAPDEGKGFKVAGFVNNLTNQKYLGYGFGFGPGFYEKTFLPGILYGVDISYSW